MMLFTGIPFYQELKDLLSKVREYRSRYRLNRIVYHVQKAQNSLHDPVLYRFLEWKYGHERVLKRCGEAYPVVIYPAPESQLNDLESVLLVLERHRPRDEGLIIRDATYRSLLEWLGRPLQNRPIYTMIELVAAETLGLKCELGLYFATLDTCESLEWELLSNWSRVHPKDESDFEAFDRELPLRRKLHAQVSNPVRHGRGRSAGIGISTLIAFVDNGELYLWVKRRSKEDVAVHAGLLHVIPALMFQPATVYLDKEFSVTHNIYREYLEEVFNRPEPEYNEGDFAYFYGDPRLRFLQKLIDAKEAQLLLTGLAVNLLNLRPEICTLLLIRSSEWHEYHSKHASSEQRFHFNEEYAKLIDSIDTLETLIGRIPYSETYSELVRDGNLYPSSMAPPGAAAFWLAIDTLRKIL